MVRQSKTTQSILLMRVNTGIEQDKVWLNAVNPCGDMVSNRVEIGRIIHPVIQRKINIAGDFPKREVARSMHRQGENSRLVSAACRGPIPLMNVQINDHQTIDLSASQQRVGSNRTIVEDAKTAAEIRMSMMGSTCQMTGQATLQGQTRSGKSSADG